MLRNTTEILQKLPKKYSTTELRLKIHMFLPNNTRIVKVMNMTEEGEEWMVEERVITEMVYWDMVGHPVL